MRSSEPTDWSSYRQYHNEVTAMTRSAKRQYLSNLASDLNQDSTKFWRHLTICLPTQENKTRLIILM